jgi:hypothetical protein
MVWLSLPALLVSYGVLQVIMKQKLTRLGIILFLRVFL